MLSGGSNRCPCGGDLSPDDRFCSRCGSSAYRVAGGTAGPAPPVDDGHESILVEGTTAPSSVDLQEQVRSGSSLPWVVAGGLVVGLLMWGLFRWPSSEPTAIDGPPIDGASGQGPDPAVPDARAPADPGGQERDQNWSTDLMLERRARIGDGDRPDESDDPGRSADGATGSLVGDGGPLLGEQTGLGLVIGPARHRGSVEFLDLDTGRRHELAGITGSPVAMVGSVLVIAQDGAVDVADLSQPEPKPRRIAGSPGRWTQVVGIDDGAIVVFEGGAGGVDGLRAYSVDGTLVDELDVAASSVVYGSARTLDLVSNAGGVYERVGDEFQRRSTGLLQAVGDELALIHECDDGMVCESRWYDRSSWDVLDLPAPPFAPERLTRIVGDDRWLVEIDWSSETGQLTEIASGTAVRRWPIDAMMSFERVVSISADGRWFVDPSDRATPTVLDLDLGREWSIELGRFGASVFVFADLADVADPPADWLDASDGVPGS